jgi:hypothetical protein
LNRKQKIVLVLYILTLAYLGSSVPMLKTWPCGCMYMCETWIWEKPPLLFDFSSHNGEEEDGISVNWSIDWWRIGQRFLISTSIFLVIFILTRFGSTRRPGHDGNLHSN